MKNKPELNIDVNLVKKNAVYCDLIYNPVNTKTIKKFKKLKIKTINGLDMFIFQAEKSFLIWHKKKPVISPNIKRKIFKKIL